MARGFRWGLAGLLALVATGTAPAGTPEGHAESGDSVVPAVISGPTGRSDAVPALPAIRPEDLSAASAILVDAATGEVLFAHAPHEHRAPASLTKVMTAVVVLERARLTDEVVASRRAAQAGGFLMGLRAGQRLTVQDLLAALLIRSANDAAIALAEHVGGSVPGFAALMNAKAAALGLRDAHFQNPHGLDAPGHYASAYDLAVLTRYALQNPLFAKLVQTRQITIRVSGPRRRRGRPVVMHRLVRTHNRLLAAFQGADGVKTGFTNEAGRCLVASAQRGERHLIAVLLNDRRRWDDAAMLLEFGFSRLGAPVTLPVSAPGGLEPPPRTRDELQVGG